MVIIIMKKVYSLVLLVCAICPLIQICCEFVYIHNFIIVEVGEILLGS